MFEHVCFCHFEFFICKTFSNLSFHFHFTIMQKFVLVCRIETQQNSQKVVTVIWENAEKSIECERENNSRQNGGCIIFNPKQTLEIRYTHHLCTVSRCKTFLWKARYQSQSTGSPWSPWSLQDTPAFTKNWQIPWHTCRFSLHFTLPSHITCKSGIMQWLCTAFLI